MLSFKGTLKKACKWKNLLSEEETKLKGATSRFVHLEKFSLNFSKSSFAIHVNLLHPSPSSSLFGLVLRLCYLSTLTNYYLTVSFSVKGNFLHRNKTNQNIVI